MQTEIYKVVDLNHSRYPILLIFYACANIQVWRPSLDQNLYHWIGHITIIFIIYLIV